LHNQNQSILSGEESFLGQHAQGMCFRGTRLKQMKSALKMNETCVGLLVKEKKYEQENGFPFSDCVGCIIAQQLQRDDIAG
jgi:hypothetical protein